MRCMVFAPMIGAALLCAQAFAHGPQIQLTRDGNDITTRRLIREESYVRSLTPATSVYVMPLLETSGEWYSRPNDQPSAMLPGQPQYPSGPGIAYGYDQVDGGSRAFASGQHFELNLIAGLKWWNGVAFTDPGAEEIQAFRSSGSPAVTNDALTVASPATLAYSNVSATYNSEAHSGALFRLLGDGVSSAAEGDDGVYLLSMTYSSTQADLNDSDPFYFVLHKNAPAADVAAAVNSLGFASSLVQVVPEPGSAVLLLIGAAYCLFNRSNRRA